MSSKTKVEEKEEGRKRAEGTVSVGVSAFPIGQWKEWEKDCKEKYGDCRWIKMWSDHVRANEYVFYEELIKRIRVLEDRVLKHEPKKESVKTFTKEL